MKQLITIIKYLGIVILGMGLFFNFTWAQPKPDTTKSEAAKTTPTTGEAEVYHVQNFKQGPIEVEFRYVNGSLNAVMLKNTSEQHYKIDILNKNYVLGKDDSVVIPIPSKLKVLNIHHQVQAGPDTTVSRILKNRFNSPHIYKLPQKPGLVETDEGAAKSKQETTNQQTTEQPTTKQ